MVCFIQRCSLLLQEKRGETKKHIKWMVNCSLQLLIIIFVCTIKTLAFLTHLLQLWPVKYSRVTIYWNMVTTQNGIAKAMSTIVIETVLPVLDLKM